MKLWIGTPKDRGAGIVLFGRFLAIQTKRTVVGVALFCPTEWWWESWRNSALGYYRNRSICHGGQLRVLMIQICWIDVWMLHRYEQQST